MSWDQFSILGIISIIDENPCSYLREEFNGVDDEFFFTEIPPILQQASRGDSRDAVAVAVSPKITSRETVHGDTRP